MEPLRKFNGWHRLWVLVSVCLLLPTIYLSYISRPTKAPIHEDWVRDILEYLVIHEPSLANHDPVELAQKYREIPNEQLVDKILSNYVPKHPALKAGVDSVSQIYRDKLDQFATQTLVHFLTALAIWFCFMSAVYLAGASIGWVYRGFKQGSGAV